MKKRRLANRIIDAVHSNVGGTLNELYREMAVTKTSDRRNVRRMLAQLYTKKRVLPLFNRETGVQMHFFPYSKEYQKFGEEQQPNGK